MGTLSLGTCWVISLPSIYLTSSVWGRSLIREVMILLAVPQDRDPITDAIDLFQPVRNIDDGQAFLLGPLQKREKLVGCLMIQPGRGFIENQDAG